MTSLVFLGSVAAAAGEASPPEESSALHDGRHLIELAYSSIDGFDGDIAVVGTSYTYSYSRNLRLAGTMQFLELDSVDIDGPDGSKEFSANGVGDSLLTIQYDPGANLGSNPWLPKTLGVFGALLLPTGDSSDGLSGDAWGASVGAGWPIFVNSKLLIVPSVGYTKTFNHGDDAIPLEELGVGASLLWLSPLGLWLGFEPSISWDFENNESIDAFALILGKTFPNGVGIDLRWSNKRRFENFAKRDDKIFLLNVSWQFGSPPRD